MRVHLKAGSHLPMGIAVSGCRVWDAHSRKHAYEKGELMAKDDRELLEGIASEMGAVAPREMTDKELVAFITEEKK